MDLDQRAIVEATADHVEYTYTLAFISGTAPLNFSVSVAFHPVGTIASATFRSI